MPDYLKQLKQPFSKLLKGASSPLLKRLTVRERPGKMCFRFWQEGTGYDRNLFTPAAIQASLDYIHNNPVQRGLCRKAVDWKWSSARYYLLDPPGEQFPDLPHIHGLQDAWDRGPEQNGKNVFAPGHLCALSTRPAPPIACDPSSSGRSLSVSHHGSFG
jgi:hypothetical protein